MELIKFAEQRAKIPGIVDHIYKEAEEFHGAPIHPMDELVMEIVANPAFPQKVGSLISTLKNDSLVHNIHNNSWNPSQELAYVFLECKENSYNMDHFIVNLARSIGSPWGTLVYTYRVLDSAHACIAPESITNFGDFVIQGQAKDLADLVVKVLQSSGMSNEMLQQAVKEFSYDLLKKPAKEYSNSTELIKGLFFKTFTNLMTENGKDASKIYTIDAKEFHNTLLEMLDAFDYTTASEYNLFYKLLAKDSQEEVVNSSDSLEQSGPLVESFAQEDRILELVFQKQELVEGITGLMRKNIEKSADLNCLEDGYGSKYDNYGANTAGKEGFINIDVYNNNKYKHKLHSDSYGKDFVINFYKIVQNNPGDMAPSMLRDDDYYAYSGVKCAILEVIDYAKEKKIVEFDADINALKADYIVSKFFARLVENNRFDNMSGFAMRDLLEETIYPEFLGEDHYNHQMNLVGEDNYSEV